jgi:hypothetical protein
MNSNIQNWAVGSIIGTHAIDLCSNYPIHARTLPHSHAQSRTLCVKTTSVDPNMNPLTVPAAEASDRSR